MRFSAAVLEAHPARDRARTSSSAWPSASIPTRADVAVARRCSRRSSAWHDERGLYDYVTCGTGSYFDFTQIIPTFLFADKLGAPYAEALKQVVKHARVQAESHIRTPENADYVIASGQADMVSIVRGQIADPHLANKAREGRADDIRPCLSCNQMCWGRRSRDYWISCLINPSVGPRIRMGRRPLRAGRQRRSACWWSAAVRPGSRRRASPPSAAIGHAGRGLRRARRPVPPGRRCSRAAARSSISCNWYEGQLRKLQVRGAAQHAGRCRRDQALSAPMTWCSPPARSPAGTGFQRALPRAIDCPASSAATSGRSRR